MSDFFDNHELEDSYQLDKRYLPDKTSCLLYVFSRTYSNKQHRRHDEVVNELAKHVWRIWEAADCCPFSWQHIVKPSCTFIT